jgi:hypothetical protein
MVHGQLPRPDRSVVGNEEDLEQAQEQEAREAAQVAETEETKQVEEAERRLSECIVSRI